MFTAGSERGHTRTLSGGAAFARGAYEKWEIPRAAGEMPVVLPQPPVDIICHADVRARGGYLGLQDVDKRAPARGRARALGCSCALYAFAFFGGRALTGASVGGGARHVVRVQERCIYRYMFFPACLVSAL